MVMTSDQIAAELQRKRNAGILPTDKTNTNQYNKLAPAAPTFNAYGGKDSYAANQNERFTAANEAGDTDLIGRLQADSKRAGYALNPYTPKTTVSDKPNADSLLTSLRDLMNKNSAKELPQFSYDPNSDPVYQSALSRAKANATTASGNAMAELNKRGILNSTITGDRLGQIEQAEYGRVSDEILPQLFQQAYGRHRDTVGDQYNAGRDELNDLGKLLDYQTGREDTTYDRNYQTGRDTIDDSRYRDETAYGRGRDTLGDTRYENETTYNRGRDKLDDSRYTDETKYARGQDTIRNNLDQSRESRISSGGGGSGGSGGGDKPANLNTIIDNVNSLYTSYDRNTGQRAITNPEKLRSYIIIQGLSDEQTDQLLAYYGLLDQPAPSGSGNGRSVSDGGGRVSGPLEVR